MKKMQKKTLDMKLQHSLLKNEQIKIYNGNHQCLGKFMIDMKYIKTVSEN